MVLTGLEGSDASERVLERNIGLLRGSFSELGFSESELFDGRDLLHVSSGRDLPHGLHHLRE